MRSATVERGCSSASRLVGTSVGTTAKHSAGSCRPVESRDRSSAVREAVPSKSFGGWLRVDLEGFGSIQNRLAATFGHTKGQRSQLCSVIGKTDVMVHRGRSRQRAACMVDGLREGAGHGRGGSLGDAFG